MTRAEYLMLFPEDITEAATRVITVQVSVDGALYEDTSLLHIEPETITDIVPYYT